MSRVSRSGSNDMRFLPSYLPALLTFTILSSHCAGRKEPSEMKGFSLIIFPSRSYNWMGLSYPCEWESFIFFLLHHYKEGFLYLYSDNFYFIPVSSGGGAERRKEIQILNIRMPRGDEKEMRMMASGCSDNRICIFFYISLLLMAFLYLLSYYFHSFNLIFIIEMPW